LRNDKNIKIFLIFDLIRGLRHDARFFWDEILWFFAIKTTGLICNRSRKFWMCILFENGDFETVINKGIVLCPTVISKLFSTKKLWGACLKFPTKFTTIYIIFYSQRQLKTLYSKIGNFLKWTQIEKELSSSQHKTV